MLKAKLQHKLDERLFKLLGLTRSNQNYSGLFTETRRILDDYTLPSEMIEHGEKLLLLHDWEDHWKGCNGAKPETVYGVLFLWDEDVARNPGDPLASSFAEVFAHLIRCSLDATSPHHQKEYRKELQKVLCDYLARKGYDVVRFRTRSEKRRGGQSKRERDVALYDQYDAGRVRWKSIAEFARNEGMERSTMSRALKRGEKAKSEIHQEKIAQCTPTK